MFWYKKNSKNRKKILKFITIQKLKSYMYKIIKTYTNMKINS